MYGIYANIGGILMVNVTIYSSTMDPMGYGMFFVVYETLLGGKGIPRAIVSEFVLSQCRPFFVLFCVDMFSKVKISSCLGAVGAMLMAITIVSYIRYNHFTIILPSGKLT